MNDHAIAGSYLVGNVNTDVSLIHNVVLLGNVYINNGSTLTIINGITVNLNGYSILLSGGTVVNQGTISGLKAYLKYFSTLKAYCGSVASAIANAGTGWTVELPAGTCTESFGISNRSQLYLAGQGAGSTTISNSFSITNSGYITVQNLSMADGASITVNGSYNTNIQDVLFNGVNMVYDYAGTNTNLAECTDTYGGASFAYTSYGGEGDIYDNEISNFDVAVYLVQGADYNVGTNNLFCNNLVDIYASGGGSYAYAISNDYSCDVDDPYCSVIYGNVFVTGVNGLCGQLLKTVKPASISNDNNGIVDMDDNNTDMRFLELMRIKREDEANGIERNEYYKNIADKLIGEYKDSLIKSNSPESVKNCLYQIKHVYSAFDRKNEFGEYVNSIINLKALEKYNHYIERYNIWKYVDECNYNSALQLIEKLKKQTGRDTQLNCELIYEEGLIYKYYLSDENKYMQVLEELLSKHPDNILSKFVMAELDISDSQAPKQLENKRNSNTKYSLSTFPNPFNPTTTISYNLAESGLVVIKVFDVLGREITSLVNENKEPGNYTNEFDGSRLASGMYIISMRVNNYTQSKKILLMK